MSNSDNVAARELLDRAMIVRPLDAESSRFGSEAIVNASRNVQSDVNLVGAAICQRLDRQLELLEEISGRLGRIVEARE